MIRILAILLSFLVGVPALADDFHMKRRHETAKSPPRVSGIQKKNSSASFRPQTADIAPACVFRRVAALEKEGGSWFLVSDENEKIPLAGVETPDMGKARDWLSDNVQGAWIKICHPRLLPLGKNLAGIIYVEPRLKSVQERMVSAGAATLKKGN